MKKIKVLMVAGSMHVGGIENQLMHLARNVDKNKFQIDFTSTMPDAAYRKEIEALGGKFILIPKMDWKNPVKYCYALFTIMKEGKYDIVHSHELFHSGITVTLAKFAGVPSRFVHAHNWCDGDGTDKKSSVIRKTYNWVMQRLICRYSTVQVACSSWAGKFVFGDKKMKSASYHLVFNSVDTGKFIEKYDESEEGEFCDHDWINIINVGRCTRVKNQLFLTEVAECFKKKKKKIRILCAGNGDKDYVEEIEKSIKQKDIEEYFRLLGVRTDIDSLMRKSSAFVLPSKYEGMPLVMIEAQASGLPCVVAATFSPEVDFQIGKLTWMSLSENAENWTCAIENAILSGRAEKSEVVKVIKQKKFDSKMFADAMCKLYLEDVMHRGK